MTMGPSKRVLVVDDDESMREAIESLLNEAGFETTVYSSAEALLAGGAVEGATCVVSDFKLPSMSGLELLAELRARGARAPVIVVTAHDAPGVCAEAVRLGAHAYLTKPFVGSALLAAIQGVAGMAK